MKKLFIAAVICCCAAAGLRAQTKIGGEARLYVYDVVGSSPGTMGFGSLNANLYHRFSDTLSGRFETVIDGVTSATVQAGTRSGSAGIRMNRAYLNVFLPREWEMKFGYMLPLFLEDYGGDTQLFWGETFHANAVSRNPWLGALQDIGFEFYKRFYIGDLSLSPNIYLLNGSDYGKGSVSADNNNNKTVLIHANAEYGESSLFGSLSFGQWDNPGRENAVRYAGGFGTAKGGISARFEYAGGYWDRWDNWSDYSLSKLVSSGYYLKVIWRLSRSVKAVMEHSCVRNNFYEAQVFDIFKGSTLLKQVPADEEILVYSPNAVIELYEGVLLIAQYDMARAKRAPPGSAGQDSNRFTLGVKMVF